MARCCATATDSNHEFATRQGYVSSAPPTRTREQVAHIVRSLFTHCGWVWLSGDEAASPHRDQIDDLVDRFIESCIELDIGDAIDLPADATKPPVPSFVTLSIETAAVPCDVVDLERPTNLWQRRVGMNDDAVRQADRELTNQPDNTAPLQALQGAKLES